MISLKDFIKTSLTEITQAMIEFAEENRETGASPNPDGLRLRKDGNSQYMYAETKVGDAAFNDVVITVDFDIAVTALESTSKEGGIGIKVFSAFTADGKIDKEISASSVSKIQFPVPLRLPMVEEKKTREQEVQKRRSIRRANSLS